MHRILVTGGCGFIGSHVVRTLLEDEKNFIVNVDRLSPCSTTTMRKNIDGRYEFIEGDITVMGAMLNLLLLNKIETVIHLAAQSHVDTSFSDAKSYIRDNVLGTQSVLEAIRLCHKKKECDVKPRLIHISTDEVYGQSDSGAKSEDALLKPSNPYAASKAAAEQFVHAYQESYKIPVVIVRGNNAFGPGQYQEKVIPRFIGLLQKNQPLTIQGNGEQQRSFIYVSDFVSGILTVMQRGENGKIYNIGSANEVSILQLAQQLFAKMNAGNANKLKIKYIQDRDFNDKRYWINSDLLQSLGWKQEVSFDTGLDKTIEWYMNVKPGYFVTDYGFHQQ